MIWTVGVWSCRRLCWETRTRSDRGKIRRKRCGNVEKKWAKGSKAPSFSFSRRPLSFIAGLETSVSTQTPVAEYESRGPWYAAGPAQESVEPLSLARPSCLFALTSHSLWGYGTCLVKGAIVLQEKSVTNIYHGVRGGGMQSKACGLQPARLEL